MRGGVARRGGSTNRPSPGGSSSRPMVARPVRYGPVRQKTNFPIGCLYVPLPDGDCPAGRTMPPVRMGILGAPVPHTAQPHIAWNSHGPRSRRAATCGDRIRLTELKLPVYAACLLPQSCEPPRSEMSLSAQMFSIYRLRMMIDVMIDVRNAKCQIVDRVASCAVRSEILVSTRIPGMYIHRARLAFSLDPCGLQT